MPIPNLLPTLTDDERKRRAEEALRTGAFMPGFTPMGSGLPDLPASRPRLLPAPSPTNAPRRMPGVIAESPPPRPGSLPPVPEPNIRNPIASPGIPSYERTPDFNPGITRAEEYTGAQREYADKKVPRWKTVLKNAAIGAVEGLQNGGLGGAVGGAIGGGILGGVAPRLARQAEFNRFRRPQILERFALEDMDAQRQRQQQQDLMRGRLNEAQLGLIQSQADENRAQAERALTLPAPRQQRQPQRRLGINIRTGQPDYYDINNPDERAMFRPYIRETQTRPQRQTRTSAQLDKRVTDLDAMKAKAEQAWKLAGQKPAGSAERQKAEAAASELQGAYNQQVARFAESHGDEYEVGGYEGPNAWGYIKRRPGGQPIAGRSGRKATVDNRFVNFVAGRLKISPEQARQMIIDDKYEVDER